MEKKLEEIAKEQEVVETTAPEEHQAVVDNRKPEETVLIAGTANAKVITKLRRIAKTDSMELVLLDDTVVHDYLANKHKTQRINASQTDEVVKFLEDANIRKSVMDNAQKLYSYFTNGQVKIEEHPNLVFKVSDIAKVTTYSHSQAKEFFKAMLLFGFVEYVDKTKTFRFVFNGNEQRLAIRNEVMAITDMLNDAVSRYCALIKSDEEIAKDMKKRINQSMKEDLELKLDLVRGVFK